MQSTLFLHPIWTPPCPRDGILVTAEPCSLPSLSIPCDADVSCISTKGKGKGQAQRDGRCLVPLVPVAEGKARRRGCHCPAHAGQQSELPPLSQALSSSAHSSTSSSSSQLCPACLPIRTLGWCLPLVLGRQNQPTQVSSLGSIRKVACPPQQCGDIKCPGASGTLAVAGRWMATYKACPRPAINTQAATPSLVACCIYLLDLNTA